MILLYLNTTNGEWFLEDGTSAGNGLPRIPYRNRETVGVQLVTATPGEDTEGVIPASDWPKDTQFNGIGGISALLTTDNNYLRHLLGTLPQSVPSGSVAELSASLPGATPGIVPDAGFIRLFDNAGNYEELEYTAREIGENNAVTFTLAQGASLSSSYASGSPVDCGEGVYAQASLDSQNSDATKGYFQFDLYCYSKKLRLAVDYADSREVEDVRGLELLVYSVSSLDGAVSIRSTWLCDGFSIPVPMALPPAAPEPSEEETENRIAPTVAAMLAYGFALQFSEDGETDWHSTQDATVDQYFRFRSKSGSGDWSDPILIPKGVDGEDGEDGKSAYQIWLDNGHTGTEAQFLASLKGDAGTSSYTYVAFASDANGSNFSLTQSSSLKYRAEIHTTTPIATPTASDFSGATWMKYLGDDGNGVDSATATTLAPGSAATASLVNKVLTLGIPRGDTGASFYLTIAYASDSTGAGFSLVPSNLLKYVAFLVTPSPLPAPSASDFVNATWVKYIGNDGDNAFTVDDAFSGTSENAVQNKVIKAKLDQVDAAIARNATDITTKQNNLSFDSTPTGGSNNPVTSTGIKAALDLKQNSLPAGVLGKFLKYGSNGLVWDTPAGGSSNYNALFDEDVVSIYEGVGHGGSTFGQPWMDNMMLQAMCYDCAEGFTKLFVNTANGHLELIRFTHWGSFYAFDKNGHMLREPRMQGYWNSGSRFPANSALLSSSPSGLRSTLSSGNRGAASLSCEVTSANHPEADYVGTYIDETGSGTYTGPSGGVEPDGDGHYWGVAYYYTTDGTSVVRHYYDEWGETMSYPQTFGVLTPAHDEVVNELDPSILVTLNASGNDGGGDGNDNDGGGGGGGGGNDMPMGDMPGQYEIWDITDTCGCAAQWPSALARLDDLENATFAWLAVQRTSGVNKYPSGERWSIDGGTTWKTFGAVECKLLAGQYTVVFADAQNYTKPENQTIVLSAGEHRSVTTAYTATSCTLEMRYLTGVPSGAQWSLDDGSTWHDFNEKVSNITPGSYYITYKPIQGRVAPEPQYLTLTAGSTRIVQALSYTTPTTGTVTLTFSGTVPSGAGWTIDGNSYTSGQTATLDPGTYAITYASVTGYDAPSTPSSVTVAAGDTLSLSAEYTVQQSSGPSYSVSGAKWNADANGTYTLVDGLNGRNNSPVFSNGTWYMAYGYDGDNEELGWALVNFTPDSSLYFNRPTTYWRISSDASAPPTSGWSGGVTVTVGS